MKEREPIVKNLLDEFGGIVVISIMVIGVVVAFGKLFEMIVN